MPVYLTDLEASLLEVNVKLMQRKGTERVRNKSRQKEGNSGNTGCGPLTVQSKGLLFPPLSGAIHVELVGWKFSKILPSIFSLSFISILVSDLRL